MTLTINITLHNIIRWGVGALFVVAAVSKIANPTSFLGDLYAYQLPLPDLLLRGTAVTLPWLELLCGLLLLANLWVESALVLTLLLYSVFLVATGQAWARGLDIACGCLNLSAFGISDGPVLHFLESARFAFIRNVVITTGCVYVLWSLLPRRTKEGVVDHTAGMASR